MRITTIIAKLLGIRTFFIKEYEDEKKIKSFLHICDRFSLSILSHTPVCRGNPKWQKLGILGKRRLLYQKKFPYLPTSKKNKKTYLKICEK